MSDMIAGTNETMNVHTFIPTRLIKFDPPTKEVTFTVDAIMEKDLVVNGRIKNQELTLHTYILIGLLVWVLFLHCRKHTPTE